MQIQSRQKSKAVPTKTCTKCGIAKSATAENFGPDARGLLGLRGDCRDCRRAADLANKKRRAAWKDVNGPSEEVHIDPLIQKIMPLPTTRLKSSPVSLEHPDDLLRAYGNVEPSFRSSPSRHEVPSEDEIGPMQELRLSPGSAVERVLFIPDCHHPYHDEKAWQLMLKAARQFKPDMIVILGDFADFYAVSSHSKNPNRARNLEAEVGAVNDALDELDALGARRKVFVTGNHCDRLERYLMEKAPEIFNMVRIRDLFRLKDRGWFYVPYKRHAKIGHLHVTHDTNRAGRYAHYQSQADFGGANVVIGHTHRLGYMIEGSAQGQPHVSAMFGWLGDFDSVDYMHQVRARRDWAHGFGVGYLLPDGCMHLTPVPLINGRVVIEGVVISL